MCAAKWLQSTIHLEIGETHSCHHPVRHQVPLAELEKNPTALHNTEHKKERRRQMLQGDRPAECEYCWRAEDAGALSDRHYKSAEDWARPEITRLSQLDGSEDVMPRYLEVSFSSACQLSCSYCDPAVSSSLRAEMRKHGPYPTSQRFGEMGHFAESASHTTAFWRWWPSLRHELRVLRLTGGEPLLSEDSFRLMESFLAEPLPELKFSLNSNLMLSDERFQRLLTILERLKHHNALKEFHLYASIDTWGEQAEWLRHGLKLATFTRHLEKVLQETPHIPVTLLVTFNALSVFRFKELLDYVLWCRQRYPAATLKVGVSLLSFPGFLALANLPACFAPLLDDIRAHYHANGLERRGANGFSPSEVARFDRIVAQWKQSKPSTLEQADFKAFVTEHDRRKGVSFREAFPGVWEQWV